MRAQVIKADVYDFIDNIAVRLCRNHQMIKPSWVAQSL